MQYILLLILLVFAPINTAQTLVLPGNTLPPAASAQHPVNAPAGPSQTTAITTAERNPAHHIALLLPLNSPTFSASADAVRQGFMAAAQAEKQALPVRIYSDFDENNSVTNAYRQAITNGAVAVVGPLTRNGVLALNTLNNFPVPTLGLNIIDSAPQPNMYYFGLATETEARQIANIAQQKGLHQAIIVTTRTPLSKRLQAAFENQWNSGGGQILREIEYGDDTSVFEDIAEHSGTLIFLAVDADKARLLRPFLPNRLPIYATSRVFVGNDGTLINFDLGDIRFVDMPWLLQIDHPAVMTYPRANPPLSIDNERLYALGIDAFRLAGLLVGSTFDTLPLDGVTGQLQLRGHTFQREATSAVFVQGRAQLSDAPPPARRNDFPDAGKP